MTEAEESDAIAWHYRWYLYRFDEWHRRKLREFERDWQFCVRLIYARTFFPRTGTRDVPYTQETYDPCPIPSANNEA